MILYYKVEKIKRSLVLNVYDSTLNLVASIKCRIGQNILLLVEDYFQKNNIKIEFSELIPL